MKGTKGNKVIKWCKLRNNANKLAHPLRNIENIKVRGVACDGDARECPNVLWSSWSCFPQTSIWRIASDAAHGRSLWRIASNAARLRPHAIMTMASISQKSTPSKAWKLLEEPNKDMMDEGASLQHENCNSICVLPDKISWWKNPRIPTRYRHASESSASVKRETTRYLGDTKMTANMRWFTWAHSCAFFHPNQITTGSTPQKCKYIPYLSKVWDIFQVGWYVTRPCQFNFKSSMYLWNIKVET